MLRAAGAIRYAVVMAVLGGGLPAPAGGDEVLAFGKSGRRVGYVRIEVHNGPDGAEAIERGEINTVGFTLASKLARRVVFTRHLAAPAGWACHTSEGYASCWTSRPPWTETDPIAPGEFREFTFLVAAARRGRVPLGFRHGIEWRTSDIHCPPPDGIHGVVCLGVGLDQGTVDRVLRERSK